MTHFWSTKIETIVQHRFMYRVLEGAPYLLSCAQPYILPVVRGVGRTRLRNLWPRVNDGLPQRVGAGISQVASESYLTLHRF